MHVALRTYKMLSHAQGPARRTSAKKGHGPYRGCGQGWRKGRGGTRQSAARKTTTPGGAHAPGPSARPDPNPCLSRGGTQPRMQLPPRLGQRGPAKGAQDHDPRPLQQEDAALPSSLRRSSTGDLLVRPALCLLNGLDKMHIKWLRNQHLLGKQDALLLHHAAEAGMCVLDCIMKPS